ncbi:MAG: hypothetical protein ABI183_00915 [Polyangiaceae bacterium]
MKLFSSDGSLAVVAVGAEPIGVFAVGQFARGFIAIGQVAIGFVTLGQGCVSVIGVGQGGVGVMWFGGMLGLGGRGICFRCIPGMDPPRDAPKEIAFQSLFQGVPEGFVRAQILETPNALVLAQGNQPLPIKITPQVALGLTNAKTLGKLTEVFAHLKTVGRTVVCDQLIEIPGQRREYSIGFQAFRIFGLLAIATFFWWAFLVAGNMTFQNR